MKPLLILLSLLLGCAPLRAEKLNIVFILADDLGWTDLGCQGSRYYETPNIDRLASEGVRFLNYHHCQNCQPTRAALMSGQYAPRTGVYTVGGIDRFDWSGRPLRPVNNVQTLPLDRVTIAQALKSAGYATALFGKWHLGETGAHHPGVRGFDRAIVSMGRHFGFSTNPPTPAHKDQYLADFLTDRAVEFIREKRNEPFFLYLPHFGVHAPHEAKSDWISHFKEKPAAGGHGNPVYAAMIASVDESVGRILTELEKLGIAEKTVVIFSSDNGGVGGYNRPGGLIEEAGVKALNKAQGITDNAPLRSGKGSLYEGGTRVPLIVRWPGVTPKGAVNEEAAIHVDMYPTLLEIAEAPSPARYKLDGESLAPLLRNTDARLGRDAIFQHFPGYLGSGPGLWRTTPVGVIQSGKWKLMEFFEDRHLELYNLAADPGESRNLAREEAEKARELHAKLIAWRAAIHAPMPAANERPPRTDDDKGPKKGGAGQGPRKRGPEKKPPVR